ncbi:hypothetical protein JY651_43300 [Pyxidicoccus parkwayensis]|uniref:Lipoprotein n=1 Tax=Pyxidicoccus parkwayensis TaxID=2813578 RepID=A0ABX7NU04_9BACT|nr:hypothetical protein [Pyxidicoccus parkwaysis]QSQ21906.1 hypothetical protein JY651_43300 [Pyxidicoccus parkwaysis]
MRTRVTLTLLLGWWVLAGLGSGCATGAAGRIPPAAFQFHEVVSRTGSEAGGWKVSQTTITLTRVSQTQPVQAHCDVEIGVPLKNKRGIVADVVAQENAAMAADEAARLALGARPATSAELCMLFLGHMKSLLESRLPGVRVRRFIEPGIPRTKFEPE